MTAAQAMRAEPAKRPSALIISLTDVFDEPRVRRQAVTLSELGWTVYLAGFKGRSNLRDGWHWVPLDKDRVYVGGGRKWFMPLSILSHRFADLVYWENPANAYMRERLLPVNCDLVIAHDYFTAPLAAGIAKAHDADYVIDCHEYARAQFPLKGIKARARWIIFERPYLDAIQRHYLSRARAVSTVCDGIADLLQQDYRLSERPAVIRSVPEYEAHPFQPCGHSIRILYHGLAVPSRGLEQVIDSVAQWRPEFTLALRLMGGDSYLSTLKQRARQNAVEDRVAFLDPIPFTDMIRTAAQQADIGYCVLEDFSPQRRFTLPNKFFEYAMAGLAIVCNDLPELRRIGDRFGHCAFVDDPNPNVIAECVNALSADSIDTLKRRALSAARILCWEHEQEAMVAAYLGHDGSR